MSPSEVCEYYLFISDKNITTASSTFANYLSPYTLIVIKLWVHPGVQL